jgi:hypothetical protein
MRKIKYAIVFLLLIATTALAGDYTEGFQGLTWGESLQSVQQKYPVGITWRRTWIVEATYCDQPARLVFLFYEGKLTAATVMFNIEDKAIAVATFNKVTEELKGEYGNPTSGTGNPISANSSGKYCYKWGTNETLVMLVLRTEEGTDKLVLIRANKKLFGIIGA